MVKKVCKELIAECVRRGYARKGETLSRLSLIHIYVQGLTYNYSKIEDLAPVRFKRGTKSISGNFDYGDYEVYYSLMAPGEIYYWTVPRDPVSYTHLVFFIFRGFLGFCGKVEDAVILNVLEAGRFDIK